MIGWFHNLFTAIGTVLHGMGVTLNIFSSTFNPERKAFTEHFEYPELPAPVAARYRGFHRFDLTTCIACDQCAKACPVDCIYIGKEKPAGSKGISGNWIYNRLLKVHVLCGFVSSHAQSTVFLWDQLWILVATVETGPSLISRGCR